MLAAQLGQVLAQPGLLEARRDARAQPRSGSILLLDGIAQDVANLLLHASPMASRAAFQARLDVVFEISNDELGQGRRVIRTMRYHDITRASRSTPTKKAPSTA